MIMEDIKELFKDHLSEFTIYVVEQKFVVGRGYNFFNSYKGKANYINNNELAVKRINNIINWISKKIPPIAELIKSSFIVKENAFIGTVEIITALSKLFCTQNHQAVGPDVIDPIIIPEGEVSKKYITQLIHLHRESFLKPAIIIMLKDNNFERAKEILSECPHGTNLKFIYNNGNSVLHKVINVGSQNIEDFLTAFSHQCFSTCSKTKHDIILNKEWIENSIIKLYVPRILKYRSCLLCDEKEDIKQSLDLIILQLENHLAADDSEMELIKNFLCITKMYRVFCNDNGNKDILDTYEMAKELNNDLLLAYIYKHAYFFPNKDINQQNAMLQKGYDIFSKNNMLDNALYCKNNILVRQFDTNRINTADFLNMLGDAISDVPGLVGMPHIYNNVGMSLMLSANPERALELFDKGLDYSKIPERQVQNIALLCNKLITQWYYGEKIEFATLNKIMIQIFDGMVKNNQLPFISARYAVNILIIAINTNINWAKELLAKYKIIELINKGLKDNLIGSGQLLLQLDYIDQKLPNINIKTKCQMPSHYIEQTGRRKEFIEKTGLNPFYFFTWI